MASAALLVLTLGTPALAQPTWTITPTPTAGNGSALESVYTASPAGAWAAGLQFGANGSFSQLVEHWNGSAWQIASLPAVSQFSTELTSVNGTSADDIWAVGYQMTSSSSGPYPPKMTLIMHWDGTSWTRVPSPNPGSVVSSLQVVRAFGPNDAWASGFASNGQNTPVTHFVLHWNGTSWSQVTTPDPDMTLAGGSSGSDVWFMGEGTSATPWHWNGSSFTQEPGPVSGTVAAVSPTQAWGIGRDANGGTTLTRWNGSTWSTVQTLPAGESLSALAPLSANDVWAVGVQDTAGGGLATLTMQWNGSAWVAVPSPNPQQAGSSPVLIGVAAAAPSTVIAVGDGSGTSANQALAMVSGNG